MYNVFHDDTKRTRCVYTCFNNHRNNNQTWTAYDLEILLKQNLI